ncbi:MAG TPA: phytanoyl-CoA dioxygenase family protein [Chitinophagales bacterium]|nr:phytanoyl-CoA dioxygenase family protein [Chitinophagales bacterium]
MRIAFNNFEHEELFRENGYLIIPNFLNEEDIKNFSKFQSSIPAASDDTFYSSHWNNDKEYRKHVDSFIRPILFEKAKDLLLDYRPVYGYYLVKMPGDKGTVSVHQDWMLVDESKFAGLTIWIPLIDTHLGNGSFQIMENSHKFLSQIRGSNTHFPYRSNLEEVQETFLSNINMGKGDAIIFDHRLAHGSLPNLSNHPRVAVGLVVLPKEAAMIHYYFNPDKKEASLYQVDDNFLIDFGLKDQPDQYTFIKTVPFTNPILPTENLAISYEINKGI